MTDKVLFLFRLIGFIVLPGFEVSGTLFPFKFIYYLLGGFCLQIVLCREISWHIWAFHFQFSIIRLLFFFHILYSDNSHVYCYRFLVEWPNAIASFFGHANISLTVIISFLIGFFFKYDILAFLALHSFFFFFFLNYKCLLLLPLLKKILLKLFTIFNQAPKIVTQTLLIQMAFGYLVMVH